LIQQVMQMQPKPPMDTTQGAIQISQLENDRRSKLDQGELQIKGTALQDERDKAQKEIEVQHAEEERKRQKDAQDYSLRMHEIDLERKNNHAALIKQQADYESGVQSSGVEQSQIEAECEQLRLRAIEIDGKHRRDREELDLRRADQDRQHALAAHQIMQQRAEHAAQVERDRAEGAVKAHQAISAHEIAKGDLAMRAKELRKQARETASAD